MFSLFDIIAFETVAGVFFIFDENTCDRQSTCYQTILRFHISEREIFSNSTYRRLFENLEKSTAVQVSAVFGNREHAHSGRVF